MQEVAKRCGVLAIAIMALAMAACAHTPASSGDSKAEVTALIEQWADARVKGDVVFLESFYAEDLRIGQMNGDLIDRKDDIAMFAARRIQPEYIRDTDMTVSVYGNTAVVSCIENLKGSYNGRAGELSLRMLNVLAKIDGRWRLVASQSVPVAK